MIRRCMGICLLWVVGLWATSLVPAEATVLRRGNVVTIGPGQVVEDDLVVAAQRVVVEGTVRGDLIVTATSLRVPGRVTGNLLGLTQSLEVPGTVDGSLRAATQIASITGQVGRNISLATQNASIARGASIDRDAHIAAQSVELNGTVGGQAGLAAQSASIGGTVARQLRFDGNNLTVGPAALSGATSWCARPGRRRSLPGQRSPGRCVVCRSNPDGSEGLPRGQVPGSVVQPSPCGGTLHCRRSRSGAGATLPALGGRSTAGEAGMEHRVGHHALHHCSHRGAGGGLHPCGIPLSLLAWAVGDSRFSSPPSRSRSTWGASSPEWLRRGAPLSPYANLAIGLLLIALASAIPLPGAIGVAGCRLLRTRDVRPGRA